MTEETKEGLNKESFYYAILIVLAVMGFLSLFSPDNTLYDHPIPKEKPTYLSGDVTPSPKPSPFHKDYKPEHPNKDNDVIKLRF